MLGDALGAADACTRELCESGVQAELGRPEGPATLDEIEVGNNK